MRPWLALVLLSLLALALLAGCRRRHEAVATDHRRDGTDRVCMGVCRCGAERPMTGSRPGRWSSFLCR